MPSQQADFRKALRRLKDSVIGMSNLVLRHYLKKNIHCFAEAATALYVRLGASQKPYLGSKLISEKYSAG